MAQTAKDRLIEAWKDYLKENNVEVLMDSALVEVEEHPHAIDDWICLSMQPIGRESTNAIRDVLREMAKILCHRS